MANKVWKRAHIGSGSIYLKGWCNVDVWESGACLADREPHRVDIWGTTDDNYYGKSNFDENHPTDPRDFVCDVFGSWESLPFETESMEELLSRQCFEHLSKREAHWALLEAWRVLQDGGVLRLDVPDHEEALKQYVSHFHYAEIAVDYDGDAVTAQSHREKEQFMLRHLLGSRKNDFAYHMGSWTREKLIEFCGKRGFALEREEPNIHFYPAFCLRFIKVPMQEPMSYEYATKLWDAPWQYCGDPVGTPLVVPQHFKCLEIGPGDEKRRWKRADAYVDRDQATLDGLETTAERKVGDICAIPYPDQSFDFVLSSHVVEHCADPELAAKEMARVAKSGCVVTPSISKEALFCLHEPDHKWQIHQHKGCLYFFEYDNCWRDSVTDRDAQSVMHKLLRLGAPQYGPDGAVMRRWYRKTEPYLDIIHHWEGSPRIVVNR